MVLGKLDIWANEMAQWTKAVVTQPIAAMQNGRLSPGSSAAYCSSFCMGYTIFFSSMLVIALKEHIYILYVCMQLHMEGRGQFCESILSFQIQVLGNQTWVIRLGSECLFLFSHLTNPQPYFKKKKK